jgi:hypothetical protein
MRKFSHSYGDLLKVWKKNTFLYLYLSPPCFTHSNSDKLAYHNVCELIALTAKLFWYEAIIIIYKSIIKKNLKVSRTLSSITDY